MNYFYNDGGRAAAGFRRPVWDCVARSVAIASRLPYREVYTALADGNASEDPNGRNAHPASGKRTAARGIRVQNQWFKDYMASLGFLWVPTMFVGSGCTVHLAPGELPPGRLVVSVSGHMTAVVDGDIHDAYDPRQAFHCWEPYRGRAIKAGWSVKFEGGAVYRIMRPCVYGYWLFEPAKAR